MSHSGPTASYGGEYEHINNSSKTRKLQQNERFRVPNTACAPAEEAQLMLPMQESSRDGTS